jgi:hypothetical protein
VIEKVTDELLEKFITRKFGWKSLSPYKQLLMAVELHERRQADKNRIEMWRDEARREADV